MSKQKQVSCTLKNDSTWEAPSVSPLLDEKSSVITHWNWNTIFGQSIYFWFNKYMAGFILTQQSKSELCVCVCLGIGPRASVVLLPWQPDWGAGGEPGEHGVWWLQVRHSEGPGKSGWDSAALPFFFFFQKPHCIWKHMSSKTTCSTKKIFTQPNMQLVH